MLQTIAITGGIGSGKSSVCEILSQLGFKVISADEISRAQLEKNAAGYRKVVAAFGPDILVPSGPNAGEVDRRALGEIVFADPVRRNKLEQIMHPLIIEQIRAQIATAAAASLKVLFVEVPLLFEVGLETLFDAIWVVSVIPKTQIQRIAQRNPQLSEKEIRQRIAAQLPLAEKEAKADRVIDNDHGLTELNQKVKELLQTLELI